MDAGSIIKVTATTVVVVAIGIGIKCTLDYLSKEYTLSKKAEELDSSEYKKKKENAIKLTEECKAMRSSNDELEAYVQILKEKMDKAENAYEKAILEKRIAMNTADSESAEEEEEKK